MVGDFYVFIFAQGVIKTAMATDEQDNISETAVAPSLRCSHFKVKCVETHLTNEANFEKTVTT